MNKKEHNIESKYSRLSTKIESSGRGSEKSSQQIYPYIFLPTWTHKVYKCLPNNIVSIVIGGIVIAFVGGCSKPVNFANPSQSNNESQNQTQTTTQTSPSIVPPQIVSANGDPNFIVAVVQKVGSAVVRIDSTRTITSQAPEDFNDPMFRRFFGEGDSEEPKQQIERGSGSGFIINANGQILTNSHVINGADTVTVKLKDGRTFQGRVLGEDPVTDVAVVKIDANNLPTLAVGNSDIVQPGEAVIAIGNPLGLDNTVTSGIISATGRSSTDIGDSSKRLDYIQTDAAINPGNSGGPLLNARGEVIAMNTAIIKGAQGLGFAIPINTAQRISQQLITKGKVEHPYLGVQMVTLTPDIKERVNNEFGINLSADKGVLLLKIVPRSPASSAGLRPGDVIQSVNNQTVSTIEEVQKLIENSKIGSPLELQVQRNGQTTQIAVKPAPLPVRRGS
jgi:S1-C subfamily serine protease